MLKAPKPRSVQDLPHPSDSLCRKPSVLVYSLEIRMDFTMALGSAILKIAPFEAEKVNTMNRSMYDCDTNPLVMTFQTTVYCFCTRVNQCWISSANSKKQNLPTDHENRKDEQVTLCIFNQSE